MSETIENQGVVIDIRNVNIYQQQSLILRDVSLKVDRGEFVYLIGKTGSGKSSLLKIIYGDIGVEDGIATVAGFDLKKLSIRKVPKLRRKLGIVFQDFHLLTDRTVADNLKFVLKATGWKDKQTMEHRVHEVLDLVGLKTKGFKQTFELSGGEQQRVVIARALLNKPELILADEPTGNLDPETSNDIMYLLQQINEETKTSVLMATHDYYMLEKFPHRTIRCMNGLLVESEDFVM